MYRRLPDPKSWLRVFLDREFHDAYKRIGTSFGHGIGSTHTEVHFQLNIIVAILGLPLNISSRGIMQFSHKKWAIAMNALLPNKAIDPNKKRTYFGAGNDTHMNRTIGSFHAISEKAATSKNKGKSLRETFKLRYSRQVPAHIGRWINELFGTVAQLLSRGGRERKITLRVLQKMALRYSNEYDQLLDKLVEVPNWSKILRKETGVEEQRSMRTSTEIVNVVSKADADECAKNKSEKPQHQKRKAIDVNEAESPVRELSTYEQQREERIARNIKRLRRLGLLN